MKEWLTRIRGAIVMGLAWAVVWAPIAVLAGLIVDPDGSMDEMWPAIGAYPGFLCGVVFSAVLGVAEGRRRFDELPLARVSAWGAVAGLLLGGLGMAAGAPAIFLGVTTLGYYGNASAVVMRGRQPEDA